MSSPDDPGPEVTNVLGYLLKHAHLHLDAATTEALSPLGVDPRELGVLRVLATHESTSQQEVAVMLGVDRTSMVALLDGLEGKGIVSRHPLPHDRRRNVIELTGPGRDLYLRASDVYAAAEREFMAPLGEGARAFQAALHALVVPGRK
jgi:DNA-binding MarR family transcriptional regulator